ncbi:MAG: hypothetical protein HKN58_06320 [Xanthomonadales bacterium]|nr:hypothetical protein [Xanthomonadales bacterium]
MRRLPWIQYLALALACSCGNPALAESGMYRVEVLVFNHIDSGAQPIEREQLRAFARFPEPGDDLVQPAPYQLDVMSSAMQDVWRRLRLSSGFRPLLFTTWEQTRIDYHPPVRLHDDEVIAEQLHFPGNIAVIDLQALDPFEEYLAPYYRLDGTMQLARSRFLHLNLDLEYRQDLLPKPHELPESREAALAQREESVSEVLGASPGPALIHHLRQSRQVRTGELTYFDTPYLGVLARVTATTGE